ncbi:platelet-derived growth factor receptor-like protein [Alosa sapidissima]|uniref:platelet-derived growth factor receptor-like protein n=1 Tax=Alosa sapidissima TaxID=34773 RepID=UPI001C0A12AA|nr:platelet-derived growth factor receptor-like protein [Alosa sapidissima]
MKWRLLLGALLISLLTIQFGHCQNEDKDAKSATEKKPKGKARAGKGAGKKTKTATAKPKLRAATQAPSAPQGTRLTQVVNKGKFQRVGGSLSVPAGETLELRCKGNPVQWGVPYYLEEEDAGRLKMVQHDRYGTLTLANATGADTGEYTCYPMYCEDTDCRKEYDKAVKVFIFFPDPQELFVPSSDYYEVIQLRTNWPTVLPCQVTNPLAKVTLHREFPPEEVRVDGTEISFDVKRGFTIHRPKQHHAGSLYCVASMGSLRQSSTKYMLIYVNYPAAPPVPVIQTSSSSVSVGSNLQVTCTVVGEQDVVVEFTWEYPGQQIGRPLYTQDSIEPANNIGRLRQRSQSVLMVDEVRVVDQGTYTCTAQNLEGSRSTSTTVKVVPKKL